MIGSEKPKPQEKPVPVLTDADLERLCRPHPAPGSRTAAITP